MYVIHGGQTLLLAGTVTPVCVDFKVSPLRNGIGGGGGVVDVIFNSLVKLTKLPTMLHTEEGFSQVKETTLKGALITYICSYICP